MRQSSGQARRACVDKDILSRREREVLCLREQGKCLKEVAIELGISYHTAKTHMQRILQKTRTMSTLAAIYAMRARYGLPALKK